MNGNVDCWTASSPSWVEFANKTIFPLHVQLVVHHRHAARATESLNIRGKIQGFWSAWRDFIPPFQWFCDVHSVMSTGVQREGVRE